MIFCSKFNKKYVYFLIITFYSHVSMYHIMSFSSMSLHTIFVFHWILLLLREAINGENPVKVGWSE